MQRAVKRGNGRLDAAWPATAASSGQRAVKRGNRRPVTAAKRGAGSIVVMLSGPSWRGRQTGLPYLGLKGGYYALGTGWVGWFGVGLHGRP